MRRLYLQIYVSFVGILVLFGFLVAAAFLLFSAEAENVTLFDGLGSYLGEVLPGPDRPTEETEIALNRIARHLPADLNLRSSHGALIARVGEILPAPPPGRDRSGWIRARGRGPVAAFRLPDGRWLVARYAYRHVSHAFGGLIMTALLGVAIAVGAYPVVRRLTRRLERLQARVDELGAGDLTARVQVEGNDEVARLARSFNRAADRIERLVQSQKSLLAGASHEIRSPLARLRMGMELLAGEDRPELRHRISKDIAELDELIGEILLASRLDAVERLETREDVDLLGLLAEEAARTDATVSGEPVTIPGDPRLLRRLIRNLLENAQRYAGDSLVEASAHPCGSGAARLRVEDRGPGVAEEERERIFEPFYRSAARRKETQAGVGLGLALVRQIARHHGGEARCLPRAGGGTSFEVTFWAKGH